MNIRALQHEALGGSRIAEGRLFKYLIARFRFITSHKVWNTQDAEEVVQNALLVVSKEYRGLKNEAAFIPWVDKVLENKIMSYIKAKKRLHMFSPLLFDGNNTIISWAKQDGQLRRILLESLNEVSKINRRYARILNLHYQGYTTADICDRLGISTDNYYVLLRRARLLMALNLKDVPD